MTSSFGPPEYRHYPFHCHTNLKIGVPQRESAFFPQSFLFKNSEPSRCSIVPLTVLLETGKKNNK